METPEAYLDRKNEELKLLDSCLGSPLALGRPTTVEEVIERKFRIAAALKAEHTLHDWALTETAWTHPGQLKAGPFEFSYDYQRAGLEVRGPSFYEFDNLAVPQETIYTSSGMAAISALLLAFARVISEADILVLPGTYGETLELIENYARHLRLTQLKKSLAEVAAPIGRTRILLLDSCAPAGSYEATLNRAKPNLDLAIFDTTGFSAGSGRISRFLSWARRWQIPIVLVRSHTKLDSLGVEFGRLGSAVFVAYEKNIAAQKQKLLTDLASEMRKAVRLFGGAALPAHFPPFAGTLAYRELTSKRMAAILRNSRRASRYFASALPGVAAELHFAHGLYVALASTTPQDETAAKRAATEMSYDLNRVGFPIRHAGSFGFDFAATEWFHNSTTGRYSVRVAVSDLTTKLWDELTEAVARWWWMHQVVAA